MNAVVLNPIFPTPNEIADALIRESVRHLQDADLLHRRARYPASVTSSIKAAELAVKSAIVVMGGLGFWDKLFITHTPFTDIRSNLAFSELLQLLDAVSSTMRTDLEQLETLAPTKFGGKNYEVLQESNPEYPFLGKNVATGARTTVTIWMPQAYFDERKSLEAFRTAWNAASNLRQSSPLLVASGMRLPRKR